MHLYFVDKDGIINVKESKCETQSAKDPGMGENDFKALRHYDNVSAKQKLLDVESKICQIQEGMKDYTRMLLESMEDLKQLKSRSIGEKETMQEELANDKRSTSNFKIGRSQSRESK